MGNLDQSDTALFTNHDSWLGQLKAAGRNLVFYGDDTWLRLSGSQSSHGSFFMRLEGVHGWLTSVTQICQSAFWFTRADHCTNRNIPKLIKTSLAMSQAKWKTMTGTP